MQRAEVPAVIAGRYRVLRLLAEGGMGTVYEVEHVRTSKRLALKLFRSRPGVAIERFTREAWVTSSIVNEHVVSVVDADVAPELRGTPFLVTELLKGADLAKACDGPQPVTRVLDWLRQVASGLDAAHAAGIVHRDLKPENLFLTAGADGSPLVKILDFGISRVLADGNTLTESGQFLGTPGYMAPEQADSSTRAITRRADLFALGIVAFRLLVGRAYWKPGSLSQYLSQLLVEPMPAPSDRGSSFGAAFDAWFLRACNRDPDERFGTAGEQISALEDALRTESSDRRAHTDEQISTNSAPELTPAVFSGAGRRKLVRRPLVGTAVIVTLASIFWAIWLIRAGDTRPPAVHNLASSQPTPAPVPSLQRSQVRDQPASTPDLERRRLIGIARPEDVPETKANEPRYRRPTSRPTGRKRPREEPAASDLRETSADLARRREEPERIPSSRVSEAPPPSQEEPDPLADQH